MKNEKAFTLLELMAVLAILSILMSLAMFSLTEYTATAGYSVAASTLRDARTALGASFNDANTAPPALGLTTQTSPGGIQDNTARLLLPGMQLPSNVKFSVSYDPSCTDASCESEYLQVRHCRGNEYIRWIRYGDGLDVLLEHISGVGCP